MAREVAIGVARKSLGALIQKATDGEEVVITRRGQPVARLMPVSRPQEVEEALRLLTLARESSVAGAGSLRQLVDEGRRP